MVKFEKSEHVGLTHFMRRRWAPNALFEISQKCDVSARVGGLPPQLCPLVPREKRAAAMQQFCHIIELFAYDKSGELFSLTSDVKTTMPDVAAIFNTPCFITARGSSFGISPWGGGFGVVVKMSFPEIKADYALKLFHNEKNPYTEHGAYWEIPTAFAANHAEPRHNCPIYMASFAKESMFMLSQWAGECQDLPVRQNKNPIFETSEAESDRRNYRDGRLIDFGETSLTKYGAESYPVRKMYRQIVNAAQRHDIDAFVKIGNGLHSAEQRNQFNRALEMIESQDMPAVHSGLDMLMFMSAMKTR